MRDGVRQTDALMGAANSIRHGAGIALRWLVLWALVAFVFWAAVGLIPGIDLPSFEAAFLTTGLIAAINALAMAAADPNRPSAHRPHLRAGLADPERGDRVGRDQAGRRHRAALPRRNRGGFVLSLSLMILTPALSLDDDARQLRVVRRRARGVSEENRTEVPGVILFEIDGLAEPVLRRALDDGHAPTMARWLEEGSHRVVPWECDLSSQTGASQAGLLLGSNYDMPAFRWYEKESGRTMVSNHGKDAVELERRRSDGGGLLAVGGASRGNMFSGDAPRCSATMSVMRDRQRSGAGEYFAYFADPYGFTRTIALYLWDVMLERRAARRQRKRGEEHVDRGGLYPLDEGGDHGGDARPQRRLAARRHRRGRAGRLLDLRRLRRGRAPFRGRAARRLRGAAQHDAQLARLEKAVEQAPRPYHLVVLSDHGQTQGRPFRQRYGVELGDLVERALGGGEVFAPARPTRE